MLKHNIAQSKNLLDTFGYLTFDLPTDFNYDAFKSDVNIQSTKYLSKSWKEILNESRSFAVQPYADNSPIACEFLITYLDALVKPLLGSHYYYIGSDASVYFASGSAWHRDLAINLPVLKVLVYLDFNNDDKCCDFWIIPGSQHLNSPYSSLLQKSMAWPDNYGGLGGMAENNFYPPCSDPTGFTLSNEEIIPKKSITVTKFRGIIW